MRNTYRPDLRKKAQILRKNMTPQEKHLWYDFLRDYRPRLYRQKPMLTYILDFYCPKARIAVEIDGSQHFEEDAMLYDESRTQELHDIGIDILRYTNRDVENAFESVCLSIDMKIKERIMLKQRQETSPTACGGPPSPEGRAK